MISRQLARDLFSRFASLPLYPKGDQTGLRERLDAFQRCAHSEHARAVADELLRECEFAPTPVAIMRVIQSTRPPNPTQICNRCQGTGFIEVERTYRGRRYSAADYCSCRKRPGESVEQPELVEVSA